MPRSIDSKGVRKLSKELRDAKLSDSRRSERLASIVERAAAEPGASFPDLTKTDAELEGLYRFMSNEHVTPEAILEPHIVESISRSSTSQDVLVAHDTTYCQFEGEREGMGRIQVKNQGFWAHVALAMSPEREVFGVVGLRHGTRLGPSRWKGSRRIAGVGNDDDPETQRWPQLATEVGARFGSRRPIHLMDREADWFELLEHLVTQKHRFVVRVSRARRTDDGSHVNEVLAHADFVATREVWLSERAEGDSAKERKTHPARKARMAKLSMSASKLSVGSTRVPRTVPLHLVRVVEVVPPDGCAPVLWTLATTEPIETAEQILRVVDAYRCRWVIEELFKALKTGCAFEKRQLGSYAALLNALAVYLPIAAFLLHLRDEGRRRPDAPAANVIDLELLAILHAIARRKVPPNPTARDVMYAIAGLGGHLPRNGDPGWITLGKGYERLLDAARVVALLRSDQS
jgi:hypothetical protein